MHVRQYIADKKHNYINLNYINSKGLNYYVPVLFIALCFTFVCTILGLCIPNCTDVEAGWNCEELCTIKTNGKYKNTNCLPVHVLVMIDRQMS